MSTHIEEVFGAVGASGGNALERGVNFVDRDNNGGSLIGSNMSNSSSSTNISATVMKNLKEVIVSYLTSMQDKPLRKGKKYIILSLLYHVYIMWISIFLPTIGDYCWGEYANWIFKVVNYPVTFSLDLVPYEGVEALGAIVMVISALSVFIVFMAVVSVHRTSKHIERVRIVVVFTGIVLSLLGPTFAFILSSFIDCEYKQKVYFESIDDKAFALSRFSTKECFGSNLYLYVLSIIAVFGLCASVLATLISFSSSWRSDMTFKKVVHYPFVYLIISNILQMFIMYFIHAEHIYGRAILHLVFSASWLPIIFYELPFQYRYENSIFSGVGFARIGASIGALISSLANSADSSDIGLGMFGLTILLIILMFIVGFVGMEIYIRVSIHSIRSYMLSVVEKTLSVSGSLPSKFKDRTKFVLEKEASSIYSYFIENAQTTKLRIFIRFSIDPSIRSKNIDTIISNTDLATSFIKGASSQRSFNDSRTVLYSALLIYLNCSDGNIGVLYAKSLLKILAKQRLNLSDLIILTEFSKEIKDGKKDNTTTDLDLLITKIDANMVELKSLHKAFWKEYLQDAIEVGTLESINNRCSRLMHECEIVFTNRFSKYKHNKNFLRVYAQFLNEIKFDKEHAFEIYQEAAIVDEDDLNASKKRMIAKSNATDNENNMNFSLDGLKASNQKKIEVESLYEDNMMDGVENNPDTKREFILKNALAQPQQGGFHLGSVFLFVLISFCFLLIALILNVYYSNEVLSNVKFVQQVCEPTVSSYAILKQIRNNQIIIQIKNQGIDIPDSELISILSEEGTNISSLEEIWKERVEFYVEHIEHVKNMAQGKIIGRFTADMYEDYNSESNEIFIPVIQSKNQYKFIETIKKNVSLSEISSLLIDIVTKYPTEGYNETLKEYDFMLVFLNRETFTNAFVKICFSFLERCEIQSTNFNNYFLYFYISVLSFYVVYTALYILYIRIEFSFISRGIRLMEKSITKDVIGKIYQDLAKKVEENASMGFLRSVISQPKIFSVICLVFLAFLTIISVSMMFIELRLNSNLAYSTMLSVHKTAETLVLVQSVGFKINELFFSRLSSSIYNDPLLIKNSTLHEYREDVRYDVTDLRSTYNDLIYGKLAEYPAVLGMIPRIDQIITGTDCSTSDCASLENTIDEFTIGSTKYNEDLMKGTYSIVDLTLKNTEIDELSHHLSVDFLEFLALFTIARSIPSTSIAIIFSIVGFSTIIITYWLLVRIFQIHWNDVFHLRHMLNYVGYEYLDSYDSLRNFILYHQLPSRNILKKKNKVISADVDESKVRNILNAAVDGAILCNSMCDIEIFNPAAQRMFGCKQSDTLGTPIYSLFDKESKTELERVISDLIKTAKSNTSSESHGETVELDCVRKNQTKFPAKINLFSTLFDGKPVVTCFIKDATSEKKQNALLADEKKKSENLLRSILPESVANKLKSGETFIAEKFADITCFFSDMVGFTQMSSTLNPTQLVGMLNNIVNGFDALTDKYSLEKIKTIGDAYFCVGGIGNTQSDHPERMLRFSMDIFMVLREYNEQNRKEFGHQINIRVGINTGSAVAGVIGTKKFAYDLWGDTINTASRMESTSIAGRIQISRSTYERVYDMGLEFEERSVEAKGKGLCLTYLVKSHHHAQAIVSEPSASDEIDSDLEISVGFNQPIIGAEEITETVSKQDI